MTLAFNPPRRPVRVLGLFTAGLLVLVAALRVAPVAQGHGLDHPLPASALRALQARAFDEAEAEPGFQAPRSVEVPLRQGEGVAPALRAAGLAADEASAAAKALSDEIDTVNTPGGQILDVALAQPRGGSGGARLIGLSISGGADGEVILTRASDGGLSLRRMEPPPSPPPSSPPLTADAPLQPVVIQGVVQGSLYLSLAAAGARLEDAAQTLRLLSHRLDLSRDVDSGDRFRLLFDGDSSGVRGGALRCVEISAHGGVTRLYGLAAGGGRMIYVDDQGRPLQGGLLRTPVDAARITSGFGFRMHPILGYSRMHQGVDFGAPEGTAVYAAGDGVIEEARWNGGYGRWIRIRHSGPWETGYGHLSGYAAGVRPGAAVRQGQLVGYVGATGLATGPHLHFEVIRDGEHIDPKTADPQGPSVLANGQIVDLQRLKQRLAQLAPQDAPRG